MRLVTQYPVSKVCPKCGSEKYSDRDSELLFAYFFYDRVCDSCHTRYTPPMPLWNSLIFFVIGLGLFTLAISMVADMIFFQQELYDFVLKGIIGITDILVSYILSILCAVVSGSIGLGVLIYSVAILFGRKQLRNRKVTATVSSESSNKEPEKPKATSTGETQATPNPVLTCPECGTRYMSSRNDKCPKCG